MVWRKINGFLWLSVYCNLDTFFPCVRRGCFSRCCLAQNNIEPTAIRRTDVRITEREYTWALKAIDSSTNGFNYTVSVVLEDFSVTYICILIQPRVGLIMAVAFSGFVSHSEGVNIATPHFQSFSALTLKLGFQCINDRLICDLDWFARCGMFSFNSTQMGWLKYDGLPWLQCSLTVYTSSSQILWELENHCGEY